MTRSICLFLLLSWTARAFAAEDCDEPPHAKVAPTWYRTLPIDVSLVEQKKTMPVAAERAVKIFDDGKDRIAADWKVQLPKKVAPAERVAHLPAEDGITRHVKERQPLGVHILGFDTNRVHVVLARHVGNHLWHRYHAVEADLMVERSDKIDRLLDLAVFAAPFTRTYRGIGYGDSQKKGA